MSDGLLDDVTGAHERLTEDELGNLGVVLGAYRSFRGDRRKHLAYVSMPITSGKRCYEVFSEHGVTSLEELAAKCGKDAAYRLIIKPNIAEGIAFADRLGVERSDLLFIAPSVFEAKRWRWSQDAYMSLWYRVLGELTGKHFLMDGWEYSTGGVKEVMFTTFMQFTMLPFKSRAAMGEFDLKDFMTDLSPDQRLAEIEAMTKIRLHAADGSEIRVDQALAMIVKAIEDLKSRGLPYQDLVAPAMRMSTAPFLASVKYGRSRFPYDPNTPLYYDSDKRLKEIAWEKG